MTNVIKLGKVRKQRAKLQKRQKADENAAKFGRTKAEKHREKTAMAHDNKRLDDHKRES